MARSANAVLIGTITDTSGRGQKLFACREKGRWCLRLKDSRAEAYTLHDVGISASTLTALTQKAVRTYTNLDGQHRSERKSHRDRSPKILWSDPSHRAPSDKIAPAQTVATRECFPMDPGAPVFRTEWGEAHCADAAEFIKRVATESVDAIITSPPFALTRPKQYGNETQSNYVSWFCKRFAKEFLRVLKPSGSLVVDIGGSYRAGVPVRSLYHFELALELTKRGFYLAQEFYWFNPAKMPAPVQWVNVERVRVKDSVNPVWWFSKTEHPKADNRRVLTPYRKSMKRLLKHGYNSGRRDSEHIVGKKWGNDNGGAIPENLFVLAWPFTDAMVGATPSNLLSISNTASMDDYSRRCREHGLGKHPARFPLELPSFFIEFLTDPGDLVLDPFAGSCATGRAAENLQRKWISCDVDQEYVSTSRLRFFPTPEADGQSSVDKPSLLSAAPDRTNLNGELLRDGGNKGPE